MRQESLLRAEDIVVEFPIAGRRGTVHAVSGLSLDVRKGETLGLVGESGCGKSTLGRALLQLPPPTRGRVVFDGVDLTALTVREMGEYRRRLQIIFQDPVSALNPRYRVGKILGDPMQVWRMGGSADRDRRIDDVLDAVGLDPLTTRHRRPHELSGGQCQRVAIARCLVLEPEIIVCDEPVSALDVSIQAQILNLLEDLKQRFDLTLVFIAHDLAVVRNISDRIAVMYLGKLCEVAPSAHLHESPLHPYTDGLLRSIPVPDPTAIRADTQGMLGELPSPVNPPSGCRFRTRCPRAQAVCSIEEPRLRQLGADHHVACHFPLLPTERHTEMHTDMRSPDPVPTRRDTLSSNPPRAPHRVVL